MKKVITFLSIIFLILSCKANTGPIKSEGVPTGGLKSTNPVLGSAYLWVTLETDGTTSSTVTFRFGPDGTTAPDGQGETVKFDSTTENISPSGNEDANSYSFQSGTISGVIEILSETQVNVTFSRNISPYLKISDVVCTLPNQ